MEERSLKAMNDDEVSASDLAGKLGWKDPGISPSKPVRQLVCEAAAQRTNGGASTAFGDPMEIYEARGELAEWMFKWKNEGMGWAQFVALWDVADKLLRSLRAPVLNQEFNIDGAECFGVAAEAAVRERADKK